MTCSTRRAGAEQSSKHRGGSSWLRPSRRGSRLIRSRQPPKHMPKLTKSYQKVVKMESQRGSREQFWRPEAQDGRQERKKTDFGGQKSAPRVPKWVTNWFENALKR